jgi:hypothetical protein
MRWLAACLVAVAGVVLFAYGSWAPVFASTPKTISVLWDTQTLVAAGGRPHSVVFNGVSCPSDGSCVAYGSDEALDGADRPLLVTQHGQTWTSAAIPLSPKARPSSSSITEIDADSCLQRNCLAVGDYKDAHGLLHIFSNTFTRQSSTIELPVIGVAAKANAYAPGADKNAHISLSCWSMVGCMAAVTIDGSDSQHVAFELLRFDGHGWTPVASPHPDLPTSEYGSDVDQISCTSQGWCAVVGFGANESGTSVRAWEAVPNGIGWKTRLEPGLEQYFGLSCSSGDTCQALADRAKGDALVTVEKSGSVAERALPRNFNFYTFSCAATICAFSGDAETSGGYLGTKSGGSVSTVRAQPGDAPLRIDSIACATPGYCVAAGGYQLDPASGASTPLVEIFSGGSWKATTPSFPPGAKRGTLDGVACSTSSHCVAIGQSSGTVEI